MFNTENTNLIWVDCEFTGIDFNRNRLLEIAVVVTDSNLYVLGEPLSLVAHCDREVLDNLLEDWPREHFATTGFLDDVVSSQLSMQEAEQQVLDYVSEYCDSGTSPLCGNSVGQDRRVLYKDMPQFEAFLHYRTIDVSTIKELARRWKPEVLDMVAKEKTHRALDDIYESIKELQIYREYFLVA